jgi:hypothetical protein
LAPKQFQDGVGQWDIVRPTVLGSRAGKRNEPALEIDLGPS